MVKDVVDYEIEIDSEDTFKLTIEMHTNNETFKMIFNKSSIALAKKNLPTAPEEILKETKEITINKNYYPVIEKYFKKLLIDIERQCMNLDKIKWIAIKINLIKCIKKDDNNWNIFVYFNGNYVKL